MIVQCSTTGCRAPHLLHHAKVGVTQAGFSRPHLLIAKKADPSYSQNAPLEWRDQGQVIKIFRFVCGNPYLTTLYNRNSVFCKFVLFLKKCQSTRECFRTGILPSVAIQPNVHYPKQHLTSNYNTAEVVKENPLTSNEK